MNIETSTLMENAFLNKHTQQLLTEQHTENKSVVSTAAKVAFSYSTYSIFRAPLQLSGERHTRGNCASTINKYSAN